MTKPTIIQKEMTKLQTYHTLMPELDFPMALLDLSLIPQQSCSSSRKCRIERKAVKLTMQLIKLHLKYLKESALG
jgi:hypothetical protein